MEAFRLLRPLLFVLPLFIGSCADNVIVAPDETTDESSQGTFLTLHATSESNTRIQLDGLTMKWEDGDKLLLVDVGGNNPDVEMVTSLDEPATSAVFHSKRAVIPGTYKAVYIGNESNWDKTFQVRTALSEEIQGKDMRLQSDEFTIAANQSEVSIQLKHIYCQLNFTLSGFESGDWTMGMVSDNKVIPRKKDFLSNEYFENDINSYKYRLSFQNVIGDGNAHNLSVLLLPENYSTGHITFYLTKWDGENNYCYVFKKQGKNLSAGTKYKIILNKDDAQAVSIINGEISTSEQLLALNFTSFRDNYKLTDDIDLSSTEQLKPIQNSMMALDGNQKMISNITIECNHDNVGLFGHGAIAVCNLTLNNVSIKGKNRVGSICGNHMFGSINHCSLTGDCSIEGIDYVGGFVGDEPYEGQTNNLRIGTGVQVKGNDFIGMAFGYSGHPLTDIIIETGCAVIGNNYVGGIAGEVPAATECYSGAIVKGNNYIGGIFGQGKVATLCGNIGDIEATGINVGGISGDCNGNTFGSYMESDFNCIKCFNTGNIKGKSDVGGICGTGNTELCYSTGNINASESWAGGIAGHSGAIKNCYSLGSVSSQELYGGLVGWGQFTLQVSNSYYAGNCMYGIGGSPEVNIQNCMTTSDYSAPGISGNDTNITDIFAHLSIINSDGVYCEDESKLWDTVLYPARCPKLNWQLGSSNVDGGTDLPGWSEEEW